MRGYCINCYHFLRRTGGLALKESIAEPELSDLQTEVLIGSLLGDACMFKARAGRHPYVTVIRVRTDRPYLQWQAGVFENLLTPRGISDREVYDARTSKTYFLSKFQTRVMGTFDNWHAEWYPNGKKVVPPSLRLTPLSLAVWFADDGWLGRASNRSNGGSIRMKIATHAFPPDDVDRLIDMIKDLTGVKLTKLFDGRHPYISGSGDNAIRFARFIDTWMPPGTERKAYWRTPAFTESDHGHQTRKRRYIPMSISTEARETLRALGLAERRRYADILADAIDLGAEAPIDLSNKKGTAIAEKAHAQLVEGNGESSSFERLSRLIAGYAATPRIVPPDPVWITLRAGRRNLRHVAQDADWTLCELKIGSESGPATSDNKIDCPRCRSRSGLPVLRTQPLDVQRAARSQKP